MIENLQEIAEIIYEETGVFYESSKYELLADKIRDLVREYRFMNSRDFLANLKNTPKMREALINASSSRMTKFFRNREQLEFLGDIFFTASAESEKNKSVRILSAGCSTGQEVYSSAMFFESLRGASGGKNFPEYEVYGCDVSSISVETAKNGVYTSSDLISVPEDFRGCFEKFGSRYKISEKIKSRTKFFSHNINRAFPKEYENFFDVILCRNVLIYFDEESKSKTVESLAGALKDGGMLLLGGSEILENADCFAQKQSGEVTWFQKK